MRSVVEFGGRDATMAAREPNGERRERLHRVRLWQARTLPAWTFARIHTQGECVVVEAELARRSSRTESEGSTVESSVVWKRRWVVEVLR
jgi:hypothetical protein